VQLHVHGSYSEGAGSVGSHTAEAADVGVDTIWWSDHDFRITSWHHATRFGFDDWTEPAARGEAWSPLDGRERELRKGLGRPRPVAQPAALGGGAGEGALERAVARFDAERADSPPRSLELAAASRADALQGFEVRLRADQRRAARPLASGVVLHLAVWPEALGPDAHPYVRVELSEHPGAGGRLPLVRHVLLYALAAEPGPARREGTTWHVPVSARPGAWNALALDVSGDAVRGFPEVAAGDDALVEVFFGVAARRGGEARARFDTLRIEQRTTGPAAYGEQLDLIARVAAGEPSIRQLQGVEISWNRPHLNEFSVGTELPDYDAWARESGLLDAQGRLADEEAFRRYVVRRAVEAAHARGGLVSLNHVFGVQLAGMGPPSKSPEEVLAELRAERLHGADLLEVGYRHRGGRPLADHLRVWDELAQAELFPVGVGVSDSHGGERERWRTSPNNFVTWAYAAAREKPDLIAALAAGRAFFGDPTRFEGTLDLVDASGARMGSLVATDAPRACVTLQADGLAAGDRVRVLERGRETAAWASRGERLRVGHAVALDDARPSPVRVELWGADGQIRALSNPITFLREPPREGSFRPERLHDARSATR
jgi:hypothetical protein